MLSGRYIEIPVYALSLPEFLQFNQKDAADVQKLFPVYLRYGGFPAIHQFVQNEDTVYQYINSLYDTIVLKDIVNRHEIRNVPLFQSISRFVFDNIGNTFSAKKVADYLKSQRLRISVDTVQKYLGFLTETYALNRVQRYDIKGKRNLEIHEKYYLGDIGLRNAVLGYRESAINGLLENLVFLELKRRGYFCHLRRIIEHAGNGHGRNTRQFSDLTESLLFHPEASEYRIIPLRLPDVTVESWPARQIQRKR